ncbi:MAG: hypothetical protein MJZ38_00780 [archaeon]|nr:hypothetical protein [archaeon]
MSLIKRTGDSRDFAALFVVISLILGFSLVRSVGMEGFHILDMDATVSAIVVAVFIVLGIVFAVLTHLGVRMASLPAIAGALVALAFGTCLMAGVIENNVHYTGWTLVLFGIGCLIGGVGVLRQPSRME